MKYLCIKLLSLASVVAALKIILIYVLGCEKRKPKHVYKDWSKIRSGKLIFLNLDREDIYQATDEHRAKVAF